MSVKSNAHITSVQTKKTYKVDMPYINEQSAKFFAIDTVGAEYRNPAKSIRTINATNIWYHESIVTVTVEVILN